jgi:hypothetical protein
MLPLRHAPSFTYKNLSTQEKLATDKRSRLFCLCTSEIEKKSISLAQKANAVI